MKPLATRNYKSNKKTFFVEDFSDISELKKIIDEVITGESDLTLEGKKFIEENYGFTGLAELIVKTGGLKEFKGDKDSLAELIEKIDPLDNLVFISQNNQ